MVSFQLPHGAFLVNESAVSTSSGRPSLPSVDDFVALSRPSLVLESYEVVKLARCAVAMKECLFMAAERVFRRAEGCAASCVVQQRHDAHGDTQNVSVCRGRLGLHEEGKAVW